SRFPNVKFIIAGRGPELESLMRMAQELQVAQNVVFPGFISDEVLLKLYRCSDMAVFPSLYEPFGIVALEGMVAHVPVVVSDTGGLNQIIEHRVNGMKFKTGSSDELADCIVELLTDPSLAGSVVKEAAKSVNLFYRWEDIAARTSVIYKQAVGSN
ncbi:MAG: glycosyltransferase family 4 protein, partial [Clostridia bacterium]|nr:glycosyltransferase family 4 protein [Clostridia bacterium]